MSWPFKKQRFATIHRQALRWPASRFDYVGVGTLGTDATTTSNVPNLQVGLLQLRSAFSNPTETAQISFCTSLSAKSESRGGNTHGFSFPLRFYIVVSRMEPNYRWSQQSAQVAAPSRSRNCAGWSQLSSNPSETARTVGSMQETIQNPGSKKPCGVPARPLATQISPKSRLKSPRGSGWIREITSLRPSPSAPRPGPASATFVNFIRTAGVRTGAQARPRE